MLVYPLDPHYDQNGNGLKVELHGIGLRGSFMYERKRDMKDKIIELSDNPVYRENIAAFNQKISEKYDLDSNRKLLFQLLDL